VALAVISSGLMHLHVVPWLPGLGWGAAGGLAFALAQFLADSREGFPEGHPWRLHVAQVAARVILGAIVGAATLALGEAAAFVAGLTATAVLVGFGAKFGRRKQRPPGGKATSDANARPNSQP
jgi:hypothetical protein